MKHYKKLTLFQRYQIQSLLQVAFTQAQIAKELNVNRSTINREFKRSTPTWGQTTNTNN